MKIENITPILQVILRHAPLKQKPYNEKITIKAKTTIVALIYLKRNCVN